MSETYEQLRDAATGEGGEAWRDADGFAYDSSRLHEYSRNGTVG
jgi:hypothetical protein